MSDTNENPVRERTTDRSASIETASRAATRRLARTPKLYRVCDGVTEGLIYFGVIFTPWAFGTTQNWSIWTMNVVCYVLGAALVTKWVVRWIAGYVPPRWGEDFTEAGGWRREAGGELSVVSGRESEVGSQRSEVSSPWSVVRGHKMGKILTRGLAGLTVVILAYCLISALNARARFVWDELRFDYFENFIEWLPHSYDSGSTWKAFWQYLGLAFFFWATRDWLLGKTRRERREARGESVDHGLEVSGRVERGLEADVQGSASSAAARTSVLADRLPQESRSHGAVLPMRLRRLLWVLCINGALLALEGILQRLDGTNKLLWVVEPRINNKTEAQFGPYAYRSNAATYLNLVWPLSLGFFLLIRKAPLSRKPGTGSDLLLLPCVVLMAAAPIVSTSRGGALVAIGNLGLCAVPVLYATRRHQTGIRLGMFGLIGVTSVLAGYLGWSQLEPRLRSVFHDRMSNRPDIYANVEPILHDHPLFGTGPGTFAPAYFLYRRSNQDWAAYAHDDWLETRATFGWVGFSLVVLALALVIAAPLVALNTVFSKCLAAFVGIAMLGCLVHAKFDFPFQVYSILFLFILECAILAYLVYGDTTRIPNSIAGDARATTTT